MPAPRSGPHSRLDGAAHTLLVAVGMMLAACGSGEPPPEADADEGAPAPAENTAATPAGEYSVADVGSGSVTYDGALYDNFLGDCEISRRNGLEEVGDLATRGLVVSVGVDNTGSAPETQMNFVALNDSSFTVTTLHPGQPSNRQRGVLEGMQYGSELTPRGTSQAIALVEFSGQTADGVPVLAQLVCEIQNRFR